MYARGDCSLFYHSAFKTSCRACWGRQTLSLNILCIQFYFYLLSNGGFFWVCMLFLSTPELHFEICTWELPSLTALPHTVQIQWRQYDWCFYKKSACSRCLRKAIAPPQQGLPNRECILVSMLIVPAYMQTSKVSTCVSWKYIFFNECISVLS